MHPISVFLLAESHGQRNLVGYKSIEPPRVEHDQVTEHTHTYMYIIYYICHIALIFQSSLFICVQVSRKKLSRLFVLIFTSALSSRAQDLLRKLSKTAEE